MIKHIAAAIVFAAASAGAIAADAPAFYAGIDLSSTEVDNYDRDEGYGAFVGYKFNQNIAVEAGYHRLSEIEYRFGTLRGNTTVDQFDVSAIGTLPLSNGFSVFGRLGYNRLEADAEFGGFGDSAHDSGVVYGAGVGYSFSPTIGARVEVQKPASDTTKVAIGLIYNF